MTELNVETTKTVVEGTAETIQAQMAELQSRGIAVISMRLVPPTGGVAATGRQAVEIVHASEPQAGAATAPR